MRIYPSKIKGKVKISGSKNAALPIIAASIVLCKKTKLINVPNITDVENLVNILYKIGCKTKLSKNKLILNSNVNQGELLFEEIKKFRASYYLMSVYLTLFNEVKIYSPGGCNIGKRPIDFHLEGFKSAGCIIEHEEDVIFIKANKLHPFIYKIPKKSLGATVNLLILGSKIKGMSIIQNASTEPEIDDLISYINKGYSKAYRDGGDIIILGNDKVKPYIKHKIFPDRIECFTYMCIGLNSEKLLIKNIKINNLRIPIKCLKDVGANIKCKKNSLIIKKSKLQPINIDSGDYPKLSTDQMPLLYPIFMRVNDKSTFTEGIFEDRFLVCEELRKINKNIVIDNNRVLISGLCDNGSYDLYPKDLRAAACLLIEGMINQNSTINNLYYLERGYDDIYKKLQKIGLNFKLE